MYRPVGFTLVELMIAVAILSILLAVAVPSYQSFIATNRIATQTNLFVSALTLARSEAVKRGSRVTVCKSADQSSCTTANTWAQGWVVFVDNDSDGAIDAGEHVLQVHASLPSDLTLTGNGPGTGISVTNYVSYVATGAAQMNDGGLQTGTLEMCHTQSGKARELKINNAGRLTLNSQATCS